MPDTNRPKRRLLFPLLVLFILALVLGGWRDEIRPGFMDLPAETAKDWLGRIGVHSGLAVFHSNYTGKGSRRRTHTARCLQVLGRSGDRPFEHIYPEKECPPSGVRLRVAPEEVMLTRFVMWATAEEATRRMEDLPPPPPGFAAVPDVLLPSIAYHFDHREKLKGTPRDELLMLYTQYILVMDTGETVAQPIMILNVRMGGGPSRVVWFPSEREVAALWTRRLPR
jgi:hypothetical protein